VETIGDAYMVASGLPIPTDKHADHLAGALEGLILHDRANLRCDEAGFAIEMVACAEEVMSPMDGEPLRIRGILSSSEYDLLLHLHFL
jgi:hypothetical protein